MRSRPQQPRCTARLGGGHRALFARGSAADRFGGKRRFGDTVPPAASLGPHGAALGMRFYSRNQVPPEYRGSIFIAEHGSWIRPERIDDRVARAVIEGGKAVKQEILAEGTAAKCEDGAAGRSQRRGAGSPMLLTSLAQSSVGPELRSGAIAGAYPGVMTVEGRSVSNTRPLAPHADSDVSQIKGLT